MIKIGDKVKAKFDLGDNPARGKKGHIYCLKGEVLIVKDILTENLTHPLRVSRLKTLSLYLVLTNVRSKLSKRLKRQDENRQHK